jgi:hypothetical protein
MKAEVRQTGETKKKPSTDAAKCFHWLLSETDCGQLGIPSQFQVDLHMQQGIHCEE